MILGIGIDTVEIVRFAQWHTYTQQQLRRIFSEQEIEYCLSTPVLSAQRFAVRFAAREALYKALSSAGIYIPFLTLCKIVTITKTQLGAPTLHINWNMLNTNALLKNNELRFLVSLTHTSTVATAMVICEQKINQAV